MLNYLEHCLAVEAGTETGRGEGLFWPDPPAVGKLLQKIIDLHNQKIATGRIEKGQSRKLCCVHCE